MTAPVSLDLARAIALHAGATRRADAALTLGSDDIDEWAEAEAAAADSLAGAMRDMTSINDVAAVVAHAYDQGGRAAEPGAQGAVLLMLVSALARRAFGVPLTA